jgi:hypothetical protein
MGEKCAAMPANFLSRWLIHEIMNRGLS